MKAVLLFAALMLMSFMCFGQAIPEGDPFITIVDFISKSKEAGLIGWGIFAVVLIVQALKYPAFGSFFDKFKYKRALITIFGQLYAVLIMVQSGMPWFNAAVTGLLVSGGAVAIFEAIKPVLPKKD